MSAINGLRLALAVALLIGIAGCEAKGPETAKPGAAKSTVGVLPSELKFNQATLNGVVEIKGVSGVEAWGRWSDGKQVTLRFAAPLPDRFTLKLVAAAYGPNVDKSFKVSAGAAMADVILGGVAKEHSIRLEGVGKTDTLTISIPLPTSPQSLGQGNDPRLLGISLGAMSFAP